MFIVVSTTLFLIVPVERVRDITDVREEDFREPLIVSKYLYWIVSA